MKRRLFTILSALSLLLCVAVAGLWVRSYSRVHVVSVRRGEWPRPDVRHSRGLGLRMVQGRWLLFWGGQDFDLGHGARVFAKWDARAAAAYRAEHPAGVRWDHFAFDVPAPPDSALLAGPGRHGFAHSHHTRRTPGRTDISNYVMGPAWATAMVLLAPPLCRAAFLYRRRRRGRLGLCPRCGYDLTANVSGTCPECGAFVAKGTA